MSDLIQPGARDISAFHPTQTQVKLATLEGDVVRFRKLKDWPELEKAVDAIIAEQAAFVAAWDAMVRSAGQPSIVAPGGQLAVRDATELWGFDKQTVSRWRTSLKAPDKYRERLIVGSHRIASLEPAENHRAEGTGENEWYTPGKYIEAAREVMGGIDLDPASHPAAQETVQAARYFTKDDDGLAQEWHGRVWLNPPYAQPAIEHFAVKMVEEFAAGRVAQAVMLTHNYTDTRWFHIAASGASAICFTRGRIAFVGMDGEVSSPTQGQAFFYFGPLVDVFADVFAAFGLVVVPHA